MVVEPRKMGQGRRRVAVLYSGGLDSAVLVAQQTQQAQILPVYFRSGLAREPLEELSLSKLLSSSQFI